MNTGSANFSKNEYKTPENYWEKKGEIFKMYKFVDFLKMFLLIFSLTFLLVGSSGNRAAISLKIIENVMNG